MPCVIAIKIFIEHGGKVQNTFFVPFSEKMNAFKGS